MMSAKEFSKVVIPTEILNQKDTDAILLRQSTPWQLWWVQYKINSKTLIQFSNLPDK